MRGIIKVLSVILSVVCVGAATGIQAQQDPEIAPGVTQYPQVTYLPKASQRIGYNKSVTWIAAVAYHTDDSIKDVVKYFKERPQKVDNSLSGDPIIRALLAENWKIDKTSLFGALSIFGIDDVIRSSDPMKTLQTSFGVFVFPEFVVRVHIISPHPAESNDAFVRGTMIVVIEERIGSQSAPANQGAEERVYSGRDLTRRARITSRPEPQKTDEAQRSGISGVVVLRAVFSANGKVERIKVVSGLPAGLTEEAVNAARKIKFIPAVKDGRYASQYIQIEYYF